MVKRLFSTDSLAYISRRIPLPLDVAIYGFFQAAAAADYIQSTKYVHGGNDVTYLTYNSLDHSLYETSLQGIMVQRFDAGDHATNN